MSTAAQIRSLPVPDGLEGERLDAALARMFGFSRTKAAELAAEGVLSAADVMHLRDGRRVKVAGVVLVRQRPGKGHAIFVTIEDETGIVNALLWARDFEANRRSVMAARLMLIHGVVQRSEEGVVHVMTAGVEDRSTMLARLEDVPAVPTRSHDPRGPVAQRGVHPRDVRLLPRSRDFH